jgi:hypothetical protein
MKIILVRNDFMSKSGTVTILAHKDEYDAIKSNLEKIEKVLLTEPIVSAPQVHGCKVCGENFDSPEDLFFHYDECHNHNY